MTQHSMPIKDSAGYLRFRQDERRAQPRFQCVGVATIRVLALEARMEGTLLDLSVTGCCIVTKTPFPDIENPYVEVILCVDWITLRIAGVVRNRREDSRVGIEFTDVTRRKAEQIEYLIADLIDIEKSRRVQRQQPAK